MSAVDQWSLTLLIHIISKQQQFNELVKWLQL